MNMHLPQTEEARAEALILMGVRNTSHYKIFIDQITSKAKKLDQRHLATPGRTW